MKIKKKNLKKAAAVVRLPQGIGSAAKQLSHSVAHVAVACRLCARAAGKL